MTDLPQAIAELRRDGPMDAPWTASLVADGHPYPSGLAGAIATILNAVASGELNPQADHKLAVALMVEKAAQSGYVACAETRHVSLGNKVRDTICALAPADALAEVQALRAERDEYRSAWEADNADLVDALRRKDDAYLERNKLVALLASIFHSGIKQTAIEGWSDDWHGCVYIDFPWGQASWHYHDSQAGLFAHLPPYDGEWDGHTTEQKYVGIVMAAAQRPTSAVDGFLAKERARAEAAEAELAATQAKLADTVGALHDAYNHQLAACAELEEEMAKARDVEKHKRLAARYAGHYSAMNDLAKRIAALEGAKP